MADIFTPASFPSAAESLGNHNGQWFSLKQTMTWAASWRSIWLSFYFQGSPEISQSCWKCQSFPEIQPAGFTTGSEVILLSPAAPHASLSSNFTWKYRTVGDGLTPCLWSKNKGQANTGYHSEWHIINCKEVQGLYPERPGLPQLLTNCFHS